MFLKLAKKAGFCFGVKNAVSKVKFLIEKGAKVCTLGQIIHSPQVVSYFASFGVRVVENVDEVKKGEILVIRSHGVGLYIYKVIKNKGICMEDATCPFVRRIQKKVFEEYKKGSLIFIAGDKNHPEVLGIVGYCENKAFVFSSLSELKDFVKNNINLSGSKILLVAQTTFNKKIWEDCVTFLNKIYKDIEIFDSICSATKDRQEEAIILSKNSDIVVVVGGKNSSNSRKLYELCKMNCKTFFVETAKEIEAFNFNFKGKRVGLTAGASTPNFLIKRVYDKICDISK